MGCGGRNEMACVSCGSEMDQRAEQRYGRCARAVQWRMTVEEAAGGRGGRGRRRGCRRRRRSSEMEEAGRCQQLGLVRLRVGNDGFGEERHEVVRLRVHLIPAVLAVPVRLAAPAAHSPPPRPAAAQAECHPGCAEHRDSCSPLMSLTVNTTWCWQPCLRRLARRSPPPAPRQSRRCRSIGPLAASISLS